MSHIASVSWGKDSLAMLIYIMENKFPLDEVVFYDTEMEFQAIYNNRDKMLYYLKQKGIKYTELKPKRPFLYDMLERPKTKRTGETVFGDGWCGGPCRWGTIGKMTVLDNYCKGNRVYIGLAADEPHRLQNLEEHKISPIADAGMTEADCLAYCRERGWNWNEETTATESEHIDLYDILDRVSCWCCKNKNRKELKNIYLYLPQYWQRLRELQSKINAPMKTFCNRQYGEYGNIFDMEKVFEEETGRKPIIATKMEEAK